MRSPREILSSPFTKRRLLAVIDRDRVRSAIRAAEAATSCEFCVSVAPFFWGNPEVAAWSAFKRLHVAQTRDRNGVLFFVVPSRRRVVVLGDRGAHERVGSELWQRVAEVIVDKFIEGDFTGGLVAGIDTSARALARHFPPRPDDVDGLPDDVDFV